MSFPSIGFLKKTSGGFGNVLDQLLALFLAPLAVRWHAHSSMKVYSKKPALYSY